MMDGFFQRMDGFSVPPEWLAQRAQAAAIAAGASGDDNIPDGLSSLFDLQGKERWPPIRSVCVFGAIDPEKIGLIEEAQGSWRARQIASAVLVNALIDNDASRIEKINPDLGASEVFSFLTQNHGEPSLSDAIRNIAPETMRTLINKFDASWNTKWYPDSAAFVLKPETFAEILMAMDKIYLPSYMEEAINDRKLWPLVQKAVGDGLPDKGDDRTLVLTRYVAAGGHAVVFRTLFNFAARRVHEVYEKFGVAPAMTSASFEEYDEAQLEKAQQLFIAAGGDPKIAAQKKTSNITLKKGSL